MKTEYTEDELNALPEVGAITYTEEVRNGKTVRVPHIPETPLLGFRSRHEPILFTDRTGQSWLTGWHEGRFVKVKF